MTIDQIEELIRRLIAAGFAVAVVLVAPGTKVPDTPGATVVTVAPTPSQSAAPTPVTPTPTVPRTTVPRTTGPRTTVPTTSSDRTGAGGADPDTTSSTSARSTTSATRTTAAESPSSSPPGSSTTEPTATTGPGAGAAGDTDDGTTAAATYGWGAPDREDDFSGGAEQWSVYNGPGHGGEGRRSPSAVSIAGGVATLTGDASGTTAGMAWNPCQKYGRWEGRVRAPASDPSYNALLLLWPDAENWPAGGEVDFMEMTDDTRQSTNFFLHYGTDNSQVQGDVKIDATQWHNWAVEWTPESITAYVDGEQWYRTTDTSTFPPGPMHLCIQLDWFPEGGTPKESTMQVDWVRQYPADGASETTPTRSLLRSMFSW
jgi:Glycosyl hydrolases family 16